MLTRRKKIDQGTLHPAGSGGWEGQYGRGRLEKILETCGNPEQNGGEFWPALVTHRLG